MRYVVYTEIIGNGIERWYYGTYESQNRANEVALALGSKYPTYHCVCEESEAHEMGIQNLPR